MTILTWHIAKEVLKGSFLALILLLTLFNLFTFSDELKDMGTGDYGLKEIFLYLALTSPRVFYELVPSGALLGSLFVLGTMANHSEIIAMRSAGLSVMGIIRAVMLAGLILVIMAVCIGEFVAPKTERSARLLKATSQHNKVIMHTRYGIWLREGNQFVNIREVKAHSELSDITIYQLNTQKKLEQVIHAETGVFKDNEQWQLSQIKRTQIIGDEIIPTHEEDKMWKTSIAPDLLKIIVVKPNNLSLFDLAQYIDFLKENNQKSKIFEAAFWGRIINPLVTFVMLMVATPFVIGIKRGSSMGGRLMAGIIIGMSFNILDKIINHMGLVYDLNPIMVALLPGTVVFLSASYAISRVK
ncbi:MAG: LPS export ABC transporter permease LptG [Methylococcales bacterium]|nr:LPS export ABC transporter permease LptG [Methylococcales bacterium]